MICLEIRERIGNQLFQYAFARKMAEKYSDTLAINFDAIYDRNSVEEGWVNVLPYFHTQPYELYRNNRYSLYQKIIIYLIRHKLAKLDDIEGNNYLMRIEGLINRLGIFFLIDGYCEFKEPYRFVKDKILIGYFQSVKYFNDIDDVIKNEFVPKQEKIKENAYLYKLMSETESVCVSIRRGDYLSAIEINNVYICNEKYFSDAIQKIQQLLSNPVLFIFSDEIEWVKENMQFPGEVYYESGKDPVWEKLRLMSHCKHFIISNSTFSWWAQHLSQYSEKKVIAPSIWRKDGRKVDIYEDNWVTIAVEE